MAITPTPRFGMKQFSSGADPHPTRLEHNAMIGFIESNAAIYSQGLLAARPTAGKIGRYFWAENTKRLYADDGTAWNEVSPIGGGGAGVGVVIGGAATEGTAERAARADHTHAIPLVTVSANGAMLAADKKKLDAATTAATASTLVLRDAAGAVNVATPTVGSHATTKAYVDGRIQEAAEYADDAVYAIPFASATEYGHMTAADKVKLDGATSAATGNALVKRSDAGAFEVPDPTYATHPANKKYVDAETAKKANASHSHGAGDLPVASSAGAGTMSAADKAKLDAATRWNTVGTLVMRDAAGNFSAFPPKTGDDVANKSYVDTEVGKKANAAHSHGAGDLPVATGTAPGTMSAADKAKLDKASSASTANTLMQADANGRFQSGAPSAAADVANKGYVDAETGKRALASHSHGAADLPDATATAPGIMSAADKAKLDGATSGNTAGALVSRASNGQFSLPAPTSDSHAANKGYVDGQVETRAPASHNHSGANITSGTISPLRIANASQTVDGLQSSEDKTKLDGAESTGVASRIMMRDAYGRSRVAVPAHDGDIAPKGWVDDQIATRAPSSHNHTGAQITSGTISPLRIANASQTIDGLMSLEDKKKLDIASTTAWADRLVLRDDGGRASFKTPTSGEHAANKTYVDTEVKPLADNHVIHYHNGDVIAGVVKPAGEPWKHFFGPVLISTGAGGTTRTTAGATDANGYGGIWFGYDSIPTFKGILGAQMTTKSAAEGYLSTIAAIDVNTARLRFRVAAQEGGVPGYKWGQLIVWLDVWGW